MLVSRTCGAANISAGPTCTAPAATAVPLIRRQQPLVARFSGFYLVCFLRCKGACAPISSVRGHLVRKRINLPNPLSSLPFSPPSPLSSQAKILVLLPAETTNSVVEDLQSWAPTPLTSSVSSYRTNGSKIRSDIRQMPVISLIQPPKIMPWPTRALFPSIWHFLHDRI